MLQARLRSVYAEAQVAETQAYEALLSRVEAGTKLVTPQCPFKPPGSTGPAPAGHGH